MERTLKLKADFDRAENLLDRFAEVYGEVPLEGAMIAPGNELWRDYYEWTGDHMILTDEGWEPGELKQEFIDSLEGDETIDDIILDEVNAPEEK
jgi:hypothetical protein